MIWCLVFLTRITQHSNAIVFRACILVLTHQHLSYCLRKEQINLWIGHEMRRNNCIHQEDLRNIPIHFRKVILFCRVWSYVITIFPLHFHLGLPLTTSLRFSPGVLSLFLVNWSPIAAAQFKFIELLNIYFVHVFSFHRICTNNSYSRHLYIITVSR